MYKQRVLAGGIAMFLLTLSFPVLAQSSRNWNKILTDTLVVELGGKDRLVIPVENVRRLDSLGSINGLVQRISRDLTAIQDSLISHTYPTTIFYQETTDGGRTLKVNTKPIDRSELYLVKESGLIKNKLTPDSIVVQLANERKLYFILDSLIDFGAITSQDIDALLLTLTTEATAEIKRKNKGDLIPYQGPRTATYRNETNGERKLSIDNRPFRKEYLFLSATAGVGLVRDKVVPELGARVGISFRNGHTVILNATMHYFFQRRPDSDDYRMDINTFVGVEYAHNLNKYSQSIGVWYLVNRQGNYFKGDTYKFSLNLFQKRDSHFRLNPELIVTDNFRTAFPGIRVGVGF